MLRRPGWACRALAALLLGLAWGLAPRAALACECPPQRPAREAIGDTNVIVRGRVLEVREPAPELRLLRQPPFVAFDVPPHAGRTVTIAVARIWRGPPEAQLTVVTGRPYAGCGVPFEPGVDYLVYANVNGAGQLSTHRCTRTAPAALAGEDLGALGAGAPPQRRPAPPAPLWGLALAGAAGLGLWAWRRRRARGA